MGEDNDFNVQAMITRLMWTIWTSLSAVRERPLNLITHSLSETSDPRITTQDTATPVENMEKHIKLMSYSYIESS